MKAGEGLGKVNLQRINVTGSQFAQRQRRTVWGGAASFTPVTIANTRIFSTRVAWPTNRWPGACPKPDELRLLPLVRSALMGTLPREAIQVKNELRRPAFQMTADSNVMLRF